MSALVCKGESRECSLKVIIDDQSKIVIIYQHQNNYRIKKSNMDLTSAKSTSKYVYG